MIDTDIQIHSLIGDANVSKAADTFKKDHQPCALSAFSLVEFKGNCIQDLILLARKVKDSATMSEAFSRVLATGGRKTARMLAFLVKQIEIDFPITSWKRLQGHLLTNLDSQIFIIWKKITEDVDEIRNEFQCQRAFEAPYAKDSIIYASIPLCAPSNTSCLIDEFMLKNKEILAVLKSGLELLSPGDITKELDTILSLVSDFLGKGTFPWHGRTCRKIGDLLIALQSKNCIGLISSNKKEHSVMNKYLGYSFKEFPVSSYRLK
jgi:hypothetical protein